MDFVGTNQQLERYFVALWSFLTRVNQWIDLCEEYYFPIIKIPRPNHTDVDINWRFYPKCMQVPEFVTTMRKICTLPESEWFN